MNDLYVGKNVALRPATLADRGKIFQWLTSSNLTKEMMGLPNFPDSKIPTWEEFINDYREYYFDGSQPWSGQCFIIEQAGDDIGQINYNSIDTVAKTVDLDIWMSDMRHTGKGFGTEALELICSYLHMKFGCRRILISPSKRNLRAIKSFQKAGFILTDIKPDKSEMDYLDNVILVKTMEE